MREYQSEMIGEKAIHTLQLSVDRQAGAMAFAPQADLLASMETGRPNPAVHAQALNRMTNGEPWRARHSLLQLQRTCGNHYVQRVLDLARRGEGEGEVAPEFESAIERSRGGGQALDAGVRRQMESAFGADFSGVRVHTGSESHSLNRAVNAIAFTTGQDIFFRDGAYNPESFGGKELLAHELTHVVQQEGASPVSSKAQRLQIQRLCPECEEEKEKKIQGKPPVGQSQDRYEQEADRVAKLVAGTQDRQDSTRNPDGADGESEDLTANGNAAAVDGGSDGGVPLAGDAGAPAADNCSVKSGPSYSPTGVIPVTKSGGSKSASFSLSAAFNNDTTSGKKPSCCEIHQFIKWDKAYETSKGGPPHGGFPSSTPADTWIEDRDSSDKRYGHRSNSHSDPTAGCGDEYKTGTTQDQANGDTYCGSDAPGAPESRTGQFQFQLKAVDTCNSDAVKASSSVITINW